MNRTDAELLNEALHHLEVATTHARAGMHDQLVIDAVCMRLVAAIEALYRLGSPIRESTFGDTWTLMWGMRNRITHGYGMVDPVVVQRTVEVDIPQVTAAIERALAPPTH